MEHQRRALLGREFFLLLPDPILIDRLIVFLPRASIGSWLSVVLIVDSVFGSGDAIILAQSVGFTAAPVFAAAGVWFVVFGIGLFIAGCCFCCCPSGGGDSYSRACLFVSLVLLLVVTAAAA